MKNTELMPLRIPGGWAVTYNSFGDVDAIVCGESIVNFEYYKEDLLQIERIEETDGKWGPKPNGHLLDLGWYPDSHPDGTYCIRVIRGYDWSNELVTFQSKDRQKIRVVIERCLDLLIQFRADEQEISRLISLNEDRF
jgi:hypothetical protein